MSAITIRRIRAGLGAATCAVAIAAAGLAATTPKFYPDDPIARAPESQDASGVQEREIHVIYDTLENSFSSPGDRAANVMAQDVNTVDEVPDSNWFTNRLGARTLTVAELLRGANTTTGPAPGTWTVTAAKNDGVMPGFTVRDSIGHTWFLKFDPVGYPAMATGTEAAVSKLLWALGYYVPEVHIAALRPDELVIDEGAEVKVPNGSRRRFKRADILTILAKAHRDADGSYRVIASKALEGRPVGGFRFHGMRSDDPNDVVPHEHLRVLRGYGTFAAWLNHVDSKSINTLDTVVAVGGRQLVRHHLLDFGSTIGSAGVYPREAYEGWEYLIEGKQTLAGVPSLGLYLKDWRTIPLYRARSVGAFPIDHSQWDPERWKPRYPNPAFRAAGLDDKFWAARRLAAVTDEMINAAITAGRFNDSYSEEMLSRFLNERRDAIVRRYLPAMNPIVDAQLSDSGMLTFRNAAVDAGVASAPQEYQVEWRQFDNATGLGATLGATRARDTSVGAPANLPAADGAYVMAAITAEGEHRSWAKPVRAYFMRTGRAWKLVGLERRSAGE